MAVQADEAASDSEDEEEEGSRQAAADMETTLELAATTDAVVRDLHNLHNASSHRSMPKDWLLCAHYWDKQPSDEDFHERQAIVKARYCMDATLANGQRAPALLDQQKLSAQKSGNSRKLQKIVEVMRCQAEHRVELSSEAADPAMETTKLWRYLTGQPIIKADISETPGSVEEERMFSAMAYLNDDTRQQARMTTGCKSATVRPCLQQQSAIERAINNPPGDSGVSKLNMHSSL
ncbi:hypothetical protein HaLaN_29866 [Haematococcus lacustris]|uniref:Uncharacterized protein n=1 Tax=Haematococcus lacustris TaxID=44745 RepID=A0A6A0AE62_HAELA|nr:hypothetical protein HaLaN_29866 [Haematococcus lacustris]